MAAELSREALGLGLRTVHYPHLFEHWPAVDYFEIISENFLGEAERPRKNLARVRERYPVVLHGVGLNLLGHAPLDSAYLDRLCRLADRVDAPFVTDHLCWTGAHGMSHHDLLPTPYVPELVELAASRARLVQERLGRPFGLENLSSYVEFRASTLTEWEFYAAVVRAAGCSFMLDVNNIHVSSVSHGFDPLEYLRAIDYTRVLQVHIAGHTREPAGNIVDTHDHPVSDEVWRLYAEAWKSSRPASGRCCGPRSTARRGLCAHKPRSTPTRSMGPCCRDPHCLRRSGWPSTTGSTGAGSSASSRTNISDGASMAVGWTELSDKDALHATTSSDSGATFGDAIAPPEDVELSGLRLLMPDGAGVLAGAVAHFPDPDGGPSHAWPVVHQASSPGAVFEPLVDLKSVLGELEVEEPPSPPVPPDALEPSSPGHPTRINPVQHAWRHHAEVWQVRVRLPDSQDPVVARRRGAERLTGSLDTGARPRWPGPGRS